MERSVIHHDYTAFIQSFKEMVDEPIFKKRAVHSAIILHRRNDLTIHPGRNYPAPFVFPTTDTIQYFFTPGCIAVFPVQVRVYTTLVHVGYLFRGIGAYLRLIRRYFLLVLLQVARSLFFA